MNWFKLYYMMVDFNVGILLVYLPVFLRSYFGFTELQIGQLYLWAGIVAIIGSMINGYIAQRISDERKVVQVGAVMMFLSIIALYINHTFMFTLFIFTFLFFMRSTIYVIGDELIINYLAVNTELNIEFGKIRSFGSLGWGLNFLVNGIIITVAPKLLIVSWLTAAILLSIASLKMPLTNVKHEAEQFDKEKFKQLLSNRSLMIFIICNGLFWGTINNMQTYSQFIVQDLGGTLGIYGLMNSIILVVDFMVMNNSTKVNDRLGNKRYYRFIGLLLLVKYIIIMFAFSPVLIYVSVLIDPFFFGLMVPFSSKYIKTIIDPSASTIALSMEKVLSQLAAAVGSIIFGYVYSVYGGSYVFAIMVGAVVINILLSTLIDFE